MIRFPKKRLSPGVALLRTEGRALRCLLLRVVSCRGLQNRLQPGKRHFGSADCLAGQGSAHSPRGHASTIPGFCQRSANFPDKNNPPLVPKGTKAAGGNNRYEVSIGYSKIQGCLPELSILSSPRSFVLRWGGVRHGSSRTFVFRCPQGTRPFPSTTKDSKYVRQALEFRNFGNLGCRSPGLGHATGCRRNFPTGGSIRRWRGLGQGHRRSAGRA